MSEIVLQILTFYNDADILRFSRYIMDFDFLKGNIEIIILNALLNGDKYGYEIAQEIKEKTKNQYEIKQPTLYAYLKRLEGRELITSYWGSGDSKGGRRRYYKLTEIGKNTCIDYLSEWNFQRKVMDNITSTNKDVELKTLTQAEATPLFGNKTKNPRKRKELCVKELEKINSVLKDIKKNENNDSPIDKNMQNDNVNETEKKSDKEILKDDTHSTQLTDKTMDKDTQKLSKNDFLYESKSVFMAQNVFASPPRQDTAYPKKQESQAEKQYKQILENILSGQLDNIKAKKITPQQKEEDSKPKQVTPTTTPLNEVAEKLNAEGVAIKIYSPKNTYKPTPMIFINKLNCLAAWAISLLLGLEIFLMYLIFKNFVVVDITPFLVIITLFLIPPIILTVNYFHNPSKKVKSKFNFAFNFVNAWIFFAIAFVIDMIVYFLIIGASNTTEMCMYLILPSVLCLTAPLAVWVYYLINKRMLNFKN